MLIADSPHTSHGMIGGIFLARMWIVLPFIFPLRSVPAYSFLPPPLLTVSSSPQVIGYDMNCRRSDGEASGFFSDLGTAWTEAVLNADLTREEREQWADQF